MSGECAVGGVAAGLAEIALDLHVLRLITPFQTRFQNLVNGLQTAPEDIEVALQRIEQVPPLYRRCFEIVSEKDKDGVAFYKDLGGAAAHGGQQYLNIISRAGAWVMIHEAGHIMEQRARSSEEDILERWKAAIAKDKVSISRYGDSVHHEDLAEFAKVYALCLDASKAELAKLKRRSPARYALWERVLRLAKAR